MQWARRAKDKRKQSDGIVRPRIKATQRRNLIWATSINGRGVSKDEAEAAKWFRKAADQGHAAAQYNSGYAYDNGQGVPRMRPKPSIGTTIRLPTKDMPRRNISSASPIPTGKGCQRMRRGRQMVPQSRRAGA